MPIKVEHKQPEWRGELAEPSAYDRAFQQQRRLYDLFKAGREPFEMG